MAKPDRMVRLRVGGGVRLECVAPDALTETQFEKRLLALTTLRDQLLPLGDHIKIRELLYGVATAPTVEAAALQTKLALRFLREHEDRDAKNPKGVPLTTFREFAHRWATNELAEDPAYAAYRDKLWQEPQTSRVNLDRLGYINRVIGHIPLTRLTEAKCREAVALDNLPKSVKTSSTLRHYYQIIQTVCRRAISPCGLLRDEDYPLPRLGWLPPVSTPPSYAIVYPRDEAKLAENTELELWKRLLYGVDVREALRAAHIFRLRYRNIDFSNGMITIGKGKNNADARTWDLTPGVAEAINHYRGGAAGDAFIFPQLDGNEMLKLADGVRKDLIASGVDEKARPDLHASGDGMEPFRFQDFRQTAVAFWLAKDWPESKIMLRTQHTTSQVMQKHYGRKKEIARAILSKQGDFLPLDRALGFAAERVPEVTTERLPAHGRVGNRVGNKTEPETNSSMISSTPEGIRTPDPRIRNPLRGNLGQREGQKHREKAHGAAQKNSIPHPEGGGWGIEPGSSIATPQPKKPAPDQGSGFDGISDVGSPLATTKTPSEIQKSAISGRPEGGENSPTRGSDGLFGHPETLERLHALATKAKDWDLVEQLSAQLKALAAATPPNVTSLDAARKRRDEGSGK